MLESEFLSEDQVAVMLSVKPATLRNWGAMRKGPPRIKVGRTIMYRRAALVSWLEGCETQPVVSTGQRSGRKRAA